MRHEALTLAVVALLAVGASGVVSASLAPNQPTPAEATGPHDYTVEVVDPDDRLDDDAVTSAWQTAWANETVRDHFEDSGAVHFHVEAVGDELQVYVADDERAPPRVQADVDLDDGTITAVEVLDDVVTAEEVETMNLAPIDASDFATGEPVTLEAAPDTDAVTIDSAKLSSETNVTIDSEGSTDGEYTVEVTTADAGATGE